MEKRKELKIVKELSGVNDESRIVVNHLGWTSRVYIINHGQIVFKFLKNEKYRDELEHEINILKLLKNHEFNVSVPAISWFAKDSGYVGFKGITGRSITTEIIAGLSDGQKRKVGAQIGVFLKTLHAIDYKGKSPITEAGLIEWFLESFCKRKRTLKKHFNENELAFIEKLVTSFPEKSAKYGIDEAFCHGDLGYNNIILSENLEIGIIDFGDAGNLDKSYDFIGLEDDVILEAAVMAYGGDNLLMKKIAMRRQLLPLMEMLLLIDRKDKPAVEKCARKMRENLRN